MSTVTINPEVQLVVFDWNDDSPTWFQPWLNFIRETREFVDLLDTDTYGDYRISMLRAEFRATLSEQPDKTTLTFENEEYRTLFLMRYA